MVIFAALFYSDKVEVRCSHYNFLNFFIQKSYYLVRAYWPISKKRIFVFRSNLGIFANPQSASRPGSQFWKMSSQKMRYSVPIWQLR